MAAAAMVLGAGISAYSSIKQGEEQKMAYEMEAQAKRAQAAQVDIAANREIELTERRMERTQSAQMVAFGRSGVLATTGSPLQQLEETASMAMDEMNAIRGAANYRKSSLLTEAGLSQRMGKQAESAGQLNAFSSILGGFGSAYKYDSRVPSAPAAQRSAPPAGSQMYNGISSGEKYRGYS